MSRYAHNEKAKVEGIRASKTKQTQQAFDPDPKPLSALFLTQRPPPRPSSMTHWAT